MKDYAGALEYMNKDDQKALVKEANQLAAAALQGDVVAREQLRLLIERHPLLEQLVNKLKNKIKKQRARQGPVGNFGQGTVFRSLSGKTSARTWRKTK
jgi:hypothetical protein